MSSFSAAYILMLKACKFYDKFYYWGLAWWFKVWGVQSLVFLLHKSSTFWASHWQTTLLGYICSLFSPCMALPCTTLQEASSSQMDNEISIHNSLEDIVSLYFVFFNTFWFEIKFWGAHGFWDSGATSYYNLLFLPQNITENYCL